MFNSLPQARRHDRRVFFDSASSVLLVGNISSREVPTSDVTAGSCSNRISLSADCSVGINGVIVLGRRRSSRRPSPSCSRSLC
ncbi:hypothetical protein FH972_004616 [Carpinus fangiana]|uniref:Uncharacterized protein n=1 Tax=Carpinus fangiana TaxID=176857 RepID=A0A5N6QQ08_9ROSI|nr:hypothetical protein FH972_004616 [Carpinus fangiana]